MVLVYLLAALNLNQATSSQWLHFAIFLFIIFAWIVLYFSKQHSFYSFIFFIVALRWKDVSQKMKKNQSSKIFPRNCRFHFTCYTVGQFIYSFQPLKCNERNWNKSEHRHKIASHKIRISIQINFTRKIIKLIPKNEFHF